MSGDAQPERTKQVGWLLGLIPLLAVACGPGPDDGASARTAAGAGSPEWVVESFFLRGSFPEKRRYLGGEMADRYADAATIGSGLPPDVRGACRRLEADSARAVFAITLADSAHSEDWYAYLYREGDTWRLHAVRALALPGFFFMLLDSLSSDPAAAEQAGGVLENMRLTVSSDSLRKAYFAEQERAFMELAERFAADPSLRRVARPDPGPAAADPADRQDLVERLVGLHLNAIYRTGEHPGCTFVSIGGVIDNEVGYLYAPPGCRVPRISPQRFIHVERIREEWYLYKTT